MTSLGMKAMKARGDAHGQHSSTSQQKGRRKNWVYFFIIFFCMVFFINWLYRKVYWGRKKVLLLK